MKIIVISFPLVLSGCLIKQPIHPVEALLEKSSVQNRLILEKEIGNLLSSRPVKLADNVFTEHSTVIIEPNQPKDHQRKLIDGRETRQADTFSLLTEHGKCYLKHNQSGNFQLVKSISCRPSDP